MKTKAAKELDSAQTQRLDKLQYKMQIEATDYGFGWQSRTASLKMDIKPDHLQGFSPNQIDGDDSSRPCLFNIIHNLADNSADHFRSGEETQDLEITVHTESRRGAVSLDFRDNGPGIPSLGDRRVNASTLPRHEGSNLAKAVYATQGLGGEMFAQNVINGEGGQIKGLRITAVFPRQQRE